MLNLWQLFDRVKKKRSIGVIAIVLYKALMAVLLAITSVGLLLTLNYHQPLEEFVAASVERGKAAIIYWLLHTLLSLDPRTIRFSSIAAGVYAGVTTIEAMGLWYQKTWAELLVVGLTGIGIPLEIFELLHHPSLLKGLIFLVNVAVCGYLLHRFLKSRASHTRSVS